MFTARVGNRYFFNILYLLFVHVVETELEARGQYSIIISVSFDIIFVTFYSKRILYYYDYVVPHSISARTRVTCTVDTVVRSVVSTFGYFIWSYFIWRQRTTNNNDSNNSNFTCKCSYYPIFSCSEWNLNTVIFTSFITQIISILFSVSLFNIA